MAWNDDTLRLELAAMFRGLSGLGWDERCERLLARRRHRYAEGRKSAQRVCPACSAVLSRDAVHCPACGARSERPKDLGYGTRPPYKPCMQCRGRREYRGASRCLACDLSDPMVRTWMKREELRLRIHKGLALRRCTHGARRVTLGENEAPVACIECVLDVLTSPLPEEQSPPVVGARARAQAKAQAREAAQEAPAKADSGPVYESSWRRWPIVTDEICHCGSALRRHPDGTRLVCSDGHVRVLEG